MKNAFLSKVLFALAPQPSFTLESVAASSVIGDTGLGDRLSVIKISFFRAEGCMEMSTREGEGLQYA
jgi:hypothetical protein